MALSLKVCLECIPIFDGSGYIKWRETTAAALGNIREAERPDDYLLALCLKQKIKGNAEVILRTTIVQDLDDLWTALEAEYNSEFARAKAKDVFDRIVQGENTGAQYFALKMAALEGIQRPSEELAVLAVKKGLRPDFREKVVAVTDLANLRRMLYELDDVVAETKNSSPTLTIAEKKSFGGNCFWCQKKGHRERDCRLKKAGKPKTPAPATHGRSYGNRNLNVQEAVDNKDTFQYDCLYDHILSLGSSMPLSRSKILDQNLIAGWDTGSSIGAISRNAFEKFQDSFKRKLNRHDLPAIKIANGTLIHPHGSIWATLNFGSIRARMKLFVVDGLPRDIIIEWTL
jgi:hypothetical protein